MRSPPATGQRAALLTRRRICICMCIRSAAHCLSVSLSVCPLRLLAWRLRCHSASAWQHTPLHSRSVEQAVRLSHNTVCCAVCNVLLAHCSLCVSFFLLALPGQLRGRDVSLRESLDTRRESDERSAADLQECDAQYAYNNSMTDILSAPFGER
jgi:hypothetical protein